MNFCTPHFGCCNLILFFSVLGHCTPIQSDFSYCILDTSVIESQFSLLLLLRNFDCGTLYIGVAKEVPIWYHI